MNCKNRFRLDKLDDPDTCPSCGKTNSFTEPRQFNLMFKTHAGPVEDSGAVAYLRPETAQGMFTNFANVLELDAARSRRSASPRSARASATRSHRRTGSSAPASSSRWRWSTSSLRRNRRNGTSTGATSASDWYVELGVPESMLRLRAHDADELSHYSSGTSDVEYLFPWGWDELEGIAQRSDYDLNQHAEHSGEKLDYFDQTTGERYRPYVIEPAVGVTRLFSMFLLAAYDEDVVNDEKRTVLRLHPRLAPYTVAVLPLSKKDSLTPVARDVWRALSDRYMVDYDETQAIGRRYRRQDEIGTPLCVTVDFETLEDQAVTIRDRDTTEQVRVPIADVVDTVSARVGF